MSLAKLQKKNSKQPVWLPIILCWLVYTASYLGRYSYSSNITQLEKLYSVSHADAGLVSTFFFVAYGVGQVLNGIFCKRYNTKVVIPLVLLISSALNIAVFCGVPFVVIKYLWLVNGALLSVLWSTLIFVLSQNLRTQDLNKAIVAMGTPVATGTVLVYGFSALFTTIGKFKLSFLLAAVVMSAVATLWFVLYGKAFVGVQEEPQVQEEVTLSKHKTSKGVVLLGVVFAVLCAANNLVREGIATWFPSIMTEQFGLPGGLSILLTIVLPLFGVLGATGCTWVYKKIKNFSTISFVWYAVAAVCLAVVIVCTNHGIVAVVVAAFGIVSLCMYGVNHLLTSMWPLYMRDKANSGMLAGVLNGCCYVGSTISSYGLGAFADKNGWSGVYVLMLFVSIVMAGLALVAAVVTTATSKKKGK